MTAAHDLENKFRVVLGDPAHEEEGCLSMMAIQKVECSERVALDARLEAAPVPWIDEISEGCPLEIIFDRDCQDMAMNHRGIVHLLTRLRKDTIDSRKSTINLLVQQGNELHCQYVG